MAGSIIRDPTRWGEQTGVHADWALLADQWRGLYQPQMERVRTGERPWTILDALHRESLDQLLPEFGLGHLTESQRDHVNRVWHRLDAWPDSIAGLGRLKAATSSARFPTAMSRYSPTWQSTPACPGDAIILSTELYRAYKPQPAAYLGVANILGLQPAEVGSCAPRITAIWVPHAPPD